MEKVFLETEDADFLAAKDMLDKMLAPLSDEERKLLLRILLEATK